MSDSSTWADALQVFVGASQDESADRDTMLLALETPIDPTGVAVKTLRFLKDIATHKTPDDPEDIQALDEEELRVATYRVNLFERVRMPAHDAEQLDHLYTRAQELWGENPTEPEGRWVEWCLWVHLHRRRNGTSLSEAVLGDRSLKDIVNTWAERHEAREQRRRLRKVDNYARYDTPEEVPGSVRYLVLSPFIGDDESVDIDVTDPPAELMSHEDTER